MTNGNIHLFASAILGHEIVCPKLTSWVSLSSFKWKVTDVLAYRRGFICNCYYLHKESKRISPVLNKTMHLMWKCSVKSIPRDRTFSTWSWNSLPYSILLRIVSMETCLECVLLVAYNCCMYMWIGLRALSSRYRSLQAIFNSVIRSLSTRLWNVGSFLAQSTTEKSTWAANSYTTSEVPCGWGNIPRWMLPGFERDGCSSVKGSRPCE